MKGSTRTALAFDPSSLLDERFDADRLTEDLRLRVPLETEFFADALPMVKEEPLRRTAVRSLFTRTTSPDLLDVKTAGAAWGMISISNIEALLVWCIDLPQGARALLPEVFGGRTRP